MRVAEQILDLARWAPSGDNTQPWRFEIRSDSEILIHARDTRDHVVYDLDGWASQLSHGALIETAVLAATRFGRRAESAILSEDQHGRIVYRLTLHEHPDVHEDPLVSAIPERVVQRFPMRTTPLSDAHRGELERAAEPYSVRWFVSGHDKWRMAAMNALNGRIRLTIPEAFAVHRDVIAWGSTTSDDRLPAASLGADPLLLAVMRWAMASWNRVSFMNRYLGGTLMPRFGMDLVPGLRCSGHFGLIAPVAPETTEDRVAAGRAVQRFWLAATQLGLQLQPGYTPLVFARYAREQRRFTTESSAYATAREIDRRLAGLFGAGEALRAVFLGRIGPAGPVKGRSLRLPLDRLLVSGPPMAM